MSPFGSFFLKCTALVYRTVVRARTYLYRRRILSSIKVSIPVVSVGNITVGGNGKTPFCLFLAEVLKKRGYSPVILMRGYKGSDTRKPRMVSSGDSVEEVGDEALLVAARGTVPVVVAKKKYRGAQYIQDEALGDIIVLDDGHQHLALERDVNIVLADVSSNESIAHMLDGKLLPAGQLREELDSGLARTDFLILNRRCPGRGEADTLSGFKAGIPSTVRYFHCFLEVEGISNSLETEVLPEGDARFEKVVALCGLANPEPFFQTVAALGIEIVEAYAFADHHNFCAEEIRSIQHRHEGVALLCSEKDFVKIRTFALPHIFAIRIRSKVGDEEVFVNALENVLKERETP